MANVSFTHGDVMNAFENASKAVTIRVGTALDLDSIQKRIEMNLREYEVRSVHRLPNRLEVVFSFSHVNVRGYFDDDGMIRLVGKIDDANLWGASDIIADILLKSRSPSPED